MNKPNGAGRENPTPPINVLLLLTDHLPRRYRELREELAKARRREEEIRAELSRMEKHAAIEGIALEDTTGAETPTTNTTEELPA